MAIRFAILAFLSEQPLHGYAIRAALDERCAGLCEPDDGEVYRVLAALRRDALVDLIEPAAATSSSRRRRKVYRVTEAGRRALHAWLLAVPESLQRARDEMPLRLLLAELCAVELLPRVVELHAERGRSALEELVALRRPDRPPASFGALVRALHLETTIRVARAGLEAIDLWRATLARYRAGSSPATLAASMAHEVPDAPDVPPRKPGRDGRRGC
ncbi:MAG: PadR family transcriptional regulator [Thermodesulfobacteriota bacterium]